MPKPPPLSVAEASTICDIPRRTIQSAITRGELKAAHKLGGLTGAYLIERRDLDRWIAKRDQKESA